MLFCILTVRWDMFSLDLPLLFPLKFLVNTKFSNFYLLIFTSKKCWLFFFSHKFINFLCSETSPRNSSFVFFFFSGCPLFFFLFFIFRQIQNIYCFLFIFFISLLNVLVSQSYSNTASTQRHNSVFPHGQEMYSYLQVKIQIVMSRHVLRVTHF